MLSKVNGQVFTPKNIVIDMLNMLNFKSSNKKIIKFKIIDNSCGDGAFLKEILKRLIKVCKNENNNNEYVKKMIENNIFGIELDKNAYQKCIENLNAICEKNYIYDVKWSIFNVNTIHFYKKYEGYFDIVVGNPPYVRIHNTIEDLSQFKFCNIGMTDLFIAFYEMGIKMLKSNGKLCYINPSSIWNSKASFLLRSFLVENKIIYRVIDFGHNQIFKGITTYSTIVLLDKNHCYDFLLYSNNLIKNIKLKYKDIFINGSIYFSNSKKKLLELKNILNCDKNLVSVKNGVATLSDSIFINNFNHIDSKYVVNIFKASTGKMTKCFFPYNYDFDFNPIRFEEIDIDSIKKYLLKNKIKLKKRDIENKEDWWLFGRTQSIKDFNYKKVVINTTIKDLNSIKLSIVEPKTLVYSGLYIPIQQELNKKVLDLIINENFLNYIKILSKYKSGGYYSFSSIELKKYLNYWLNK